MRKLILKVLIFLTFSTLVLATQIKNVNFNSSNFLIEFSSLGKENYELSIDEEAKLVYIEIKNLNQNSISKINKKVERKMKDSYFFEEIFIDKGKDSVSITLQIMPKIYFSVETSKKEIRVDFKSKPKKKYAIVIDPGHGGQDSGAIRGKVVEKNIILAVSKLLRKELEKDFDIIMTRDKDYFVKLHERPEIGNKNKAKLFVSIHANAALNEKANGVEVFYFSKKSSPYAERIANFENSFGEKFGENSTDIAQISGELAYKKNQENSIRLAESIVKNISTNLPLRNGKIHGANFAVLRGFNGAGVLIELGFVSNKHDAKIMMNNNYRVKLAKEIAKSIRKYLE